MKVGEPSADGRGSAPPELAEVSSALVAAQQTAQAAQALHAGTIQQQITSGADQSEGSGDEPKKQGWFSRLFRG